MAKIEVTKTDGVKLTVADVEHVLVTDGGHLSLSRERTGGFRAVFAAGSWARAVKVDEENA